MVRCRASRLAQATWGGDDEVDQSRVKEGIAVSGWFGAELIDGGASEAAAARGRGQSLFVDQAASGGLFQVPVYRQVLGSRTITTGLLRIRMVIVDIGRRHSATRDDEVHCRLGAPVRGHQFTDRYDLQVTRGGVRCRWHVHCGQFLASGDVLESAGDETHGLHLGCRVGDQNYTSQALRFLLKHRHQLLGSPLVNAVLVTSSLFSLELRQQCFFNHFNS